MTFVQELQPEQLNDKTKEHLISYDLERKAYDDQGITHVQSSLLRAFCVQCKF